MHATHQCHWRVVSRPAAASHDDADGDDDDGGDCDADDGAADYDYDADGSDVASRVALAMQ